MAVSAVLIASVAASAQNLQVHYDTGSLLYKDQAHRPEVTTTLEMFRPDKGGSTFFFVDMDYGQEGIASAYWEIARELRFWKVPLSVHVEYNGGLSNRFSFNHAYLLGGTWSWSSKDFSKNLSLTASFKYIQNHPSPYNFQLTGVWNIGFLKNGLMTFSGFVDWWMEEKTWGNGERTRFIFMTEPQLWLNLDRFPKVSDKFRMSVGTELEMTYNFLERRKFHAIPTLALKWTFD